MSRIPRVLSVTATIVLPLLISSGVTASASTTDELPHPTSDNVSASLAESGPSGDVELISSAADDFEPGDAASAALLAEAASASVAVDLIATGDTAWADATADQTTTVKVDGTHTSISDGSGSVIGLTVEGDPSSSAVADGATVLHEVATDTDVVSRAIPDGAQLVAILDSAEADMSLEFSVAMPEDAELEPMADGSISIVAPVETQVEDPLDAQRFETEVNALVGDIETLDALEEFTDEQWAAIDAIAPIETSTVVAPATVATIGSPWAVDANGTPVETYYALEGDKLTQHILPTAETAFPVVADPSFWWWTTTAGKCALGVASFALGGAKVIGIATKITGLLSKASKGTQLYKAYQSWKALGSTNSARIKALGAAMKILTANISRYGFSKGYSLALKQTRVNNAANFLIGAGKSALELAGVYSCYELVHEARN